MSTQIFQYKRTKSPKMGRIQRENSLEGRDFGMNGSLDILKAMVFEKSKIGKQKRGHQKRQPLPPRITARILQPNFYVPHQYAGVFFGMQAEMLYF